jgi:methyltransferase family protein
LIVKLNLGSGLRKLDGYVNVDKYGDADVLHDLERFPWPWQDSSVDEVMLVHTLEHLGREPDVFIGVVKELYRVCKPGAIVKIHVPHPRHDSFIADPTHVRPITADVMRLFDREQCEAWRRENRSNTPLALYHGVDFRITSHEQVPDEPFATLVKQGKMSQNELAIAARSQNNVIAEIRLTLEVRK